MKIEVGNIWVQLAFQNIGLNPLPSPEQTSKEGSITMPNIIYIPDSTWIDLDQEPIFQIFMKEYLDLLQNNLKKVEVKGDSCNSSYYTWGWGHIGLGSHLV